MFSIVTVSKISSDTVRVLLTIDAKVWHKARKGKGAYGVECLYNVDLSDAVREQYGVDTHNPTVDDTRRAVSGIKTLVLFYNDAAWLPAPENVIRVDFMTRRRVA